MAKGLKKELLEIQKKGKLHRVKTAEDARSASENQKILDTKATDLFIDVVDVYVDKVRTNKALKIILFIISLLVLLAFAVSFIVCLFIVIRSDIDISEVLSILIPAGATVVTSIVSIIIIIAKYLFPRDEDKNFTDLVKVLIQRKP